MTFVCFVCFTLPTNLSSVDTDILFDFLLIFSIIPSVSQLVMAILCSLPPPISFKLLRLNTSSDDGDTVSLMYSYLALRKLQRLLVDRLYVLRFC